MENSNDVPVEDAPDDTGGIDMKASALAYAEVGYQVLPLHTPTGDGCSCRKADCRVPGKHPRTLRGLLDASADPAVVASWWNKWTNANIGLPTGSEAGLVVLDVDRRHGGDVQLTALEAEHGPLPKTRRVTTGDGEHIYFLHPGGTIRSGAGKLGEGLDIRSDGGYVLVEPSLHASGVRYEVACDADVAEMPDWMQAAITETDPPAAADGFNGNDLIPEGQRNDELTRIAGRLRAAGKNQEEIRKALAEVNRDRCSPALDDAEVSNIAASIARYPVRPRPQAPKPLHRQRVELEVSGDTHRLGEIVAQHLADANEPVELFEMERSMVKVLATAAGAKVAKIDRMALRVQVGARVILYRMSKGKDGPRKEYTELTNDQADYILAMARWGLPRLRGIVLHPVYTKDGEMVAVHGYSPKAEVFVDLGDLALPPVPEAPTPEDVQRALALLFDELFGDFPFVDEASKAHAVALGLVLLVREMIDGPVPGHLVEATSEGTGKTLLVRAIILAITGIDPGLNAELGNDDEWRKTLTAMLVELPEFVVFDNVKRNLDTPALAAAMTSKNWEGRRLGETDMIRVPVRAAFVFTGNNPTMSREIARRMLMIRLDARTETPWLRDGFRHNPILPWVAEHRGELLWAFLVLVQNWVAQGCPRAGASKGSYEEWAAVVGGILEAAGVPGFLANEADFFERSDTETAAWKEFVRIWWATHGDAPVPVSELYDLADEHEVLLDQLGGTNDRSQKTRLGRQLVHRIGRIISGKQIAMAEEDGHKKVNRYRLEDQP